MNMDASVTRLPTFKYEHLSDGEIRLLEVIRNKANEPLHINLSSHTLNAAPAFCALSYTWGDGQITNSCICTSGPQVGLLGLTENLASILENARLNYYPMKLPIWADQICINQGDKRERSKQVQMMDQIYMKAQSTLIVLGEEEAEDALGFQVLDVLAGIFESENLDAKSGWSGSSELRAKVQRMVPPSVKESTWVALRDLIHKPWFDRTWVVQELMLSSNPYVACGKSCMAWDDFYRGCSLAHEYLTKLGAPDDENFYEVQFKDEFMTMWQLHHSRPQPNRNIHTPEKTPLSGCLAFFGRRKLSDPHDKIYAFLGIAEDVDSLKVAVDYTEPYFMTYARATKFAIEQDTAASFEHQDLGMLEAINPDAKMHRRIAPSWVPDFYFEQANPAAPELISNYPESNMNLRKLEVQGVRLGTLSQKLNRAVDEGDYRQQEQRFPFTPKLTQAFKVGNGSEVNVHSSCQPGDHWYILQGLGIPCILRELKGKNQYQFCSFAQGYPFEAGPCLQALLPEYKYPKMSSREWDDSFYQPWCRRESKVYPFVTEDIVLE